MNRRGFLRLLGLGGAGAALVSSLPIEEIIDRLAFEKSPTTSLYIARPSVSVAQWEDHFFLEYVKHHPLRGLIDGPVSAVCIHGAQ